jgi:hypothetical protein
VPPFGATPRQHFAAILRFHSRAETMLLVAAANMRLKGALRQRIFSLNGRNAGIRDAAAPQPA